MAGGINMRDIPAFPYADFRHERVIRSVANLTPSGDEGFLPLASEAGMETEITFYLLETPDRALDDLRTGLSPVRQFWFPVAGAYSSVFNGFLPN